MASEGAVPEKSTIALSPKASGEAGSRGERRETATPRTRAQGGGAPPERPDLVALGDGLLTRTEKLQLRLIRESFEPGRVDRALRFCQRHVGARWIDIATRNLRHVYGLERLPPFDPTKSLLLVSNHRSFFDLYLVTALLVLEGMPHRMLFPVRSNFFYDHPLGFLVNGAMSFFAMYPPVFRERQRAALNLAGIDEVVWMLRRGGAFVGVHPEGTRKKDGDPYTFLPAQSGIGKIIRHAKVDVVPVFVNGLTNDLARQVTGNMTGRGEPVYVVFGAPVDFGRLLEQAPSPRLYRQIAEGSLEAISRLGQEEKGLRSNDVRPVTAKGRAPVSTFL
jgi:1-acyl-sn-glycerol-3-phosphate acyltransferase